MGHIIVLPSSILNILIKHKALLDVACNQCDPNINRAIYEPSTNDQHYLKMLGLYIYTIFIPLELVTNQAIC